MRILSVIAPGPTGGAETVTRSLAAAQARAGHRVVVAACYCRGEERPPLVDQIRSDGLAMRELVVPHRAYRTEMDRIRQTIRASAPDVIHTHGYRVDLLGRAAAYLEDVAAVSTVHGFTGGGWKNRAYEILQLLALRSFDRVVAVSEPLAARLESRGVPGDRIRTVPNAWTRNLEHRSREGARRELGLPRDPVMLGWVGRLTPEKGLDVAVEALAAVESAHLAVVGDGPEREDVRSRAGELGVADRVHWCGRVEDAAPLFRAFDLFVLSSRTEGTPMAVFEAMAADVPVVATDVGGVPDQLPPEAGYLVPPEEPNALADAIRTALADPDEARRRASVARRRLEREYGPEAWVQAYSDVYREAIRRRKG